MQISFVSYIFRQTGKKAEARVTVVTSIPGYGLKLILRFGQSGPRLASSLTALFTVQLPPG